MKKPKDFDDLTVNEVAALRNKFSELGILQDLVFRDRLGLLNSLLYYIENNKRLYAERRINE